MFVAYNLAMLHFREWAEWTGPSGFDAVCLFCDCFSANTDEILTHMTVCRFMLYLLPLTWRLCFEFVTLITVHFHCIHDNTRFHVGKVVSCDKLIVRKSACISENVSCKIS